jgi:hypothetical protein
MSLLANVEEDQAKATIPTRFSSEWTISTSTSKFQLQSSPGEKKTTKRAIVEATPSEPHTPTSPDAWTTSVNAPLLGDVDDENETENRHEIGGDTSAEGMGNEKEAAAPETKAEYRALSNFIV